MSRDQRSVSLAAVVVVASLTTTISVVSLWSYWLGNERVNVQYVNGDRIFEANGSEVMWRGAGGSYLFHDVERYREAWQLHLGEIHALGLNTIRLAFAFPDSASNPDNGVSSADILDYHKLDWVLSFLSKNGIKAILDLHNYKDMYGDFGSQKLMSNWVALAQRYRGDSRIVGYELFNEPSENTWDTSIASRADAIEAYANLTDAVRAVDPEHIVIWQSFGYLADAWNINRFAEVLKPYLRPNLVFTFHRWLHREWSFDIYSPENMSRFSVEYLVRAREKLNVPFWLGEFGSYGPFNFSNPEYQWTEETLWRCEEKVLGWNLWMGATDIDRPWKEYLSLFPLKVYNEMLVRRPWNASNSLCNLTDFVIDSVGVDEFELQQIEMWHNNDYVTLRAGIAVRIVVSHKLQDESLVVVSDKAIEVAEQLTIRNEEGTAEHPGDWNVRVCLKDVAS
jgi:hypothetical protein